MSLVCLVVINLTNVVLSCVPYHSHFPAYQTKLSFVITACQCSACVLEGYRACPVPWSNIPSTESGWTSRP